MLCGSWCTAKDRNRSTTAVFAAAPSGSADHWPSNQLLNRSLSSDVSDTCMRLSGFPGARPSPSVLNENEPSTACRGLPSPLRRTTVPCGTGRSARRTSAAFSTQSAQRLASQRPWSRLRAARSASDPKRLSSTPLGGRTRRTFAIRNSLSASSPNAWREKDSEAKSIWWSGRSQG